LAEDDQYMAHLFAMLLLAQFRETRAYAPVLRFAALPGRLTEYLGYEFVTPYLGRVLASVAGAAVSGIHELIESGEVNEWVRRAALDGLVTLVATGLRNREETVAYLAELFHGKLPREPNPIWSHLMRTAWDLYPEELQEDIRQAYDEGLIGGLQDLELRIAMGRDASLAELPVNGRYELIADDAEEMEHWGCFMVENSGEHKAATVPAPCPSSCP
jgi:hypothetical protein